MSPEGGPQRQRGQMEWSPQGILLGSRGSHIPSSSQASSLWLCGAALEDSPEYPGHRSAAVPMQLHQPRDAASTI